MAFFFLSFCKKSFQKNLAYSASTSVSIQMVKKVATVSISLSKQRAQKVMRWACVGFVVRFSKKNSCYLCSLRFRFLCAEVLQLSKPALV